VGGRGDVRVATLALLAEQPLHGYQIIQQITERSGGAWRPSPGSVYPALQLLEDQRLVQSDQAEGTEQTCMSHSLLNCCMSDTGCSADDAFDRRAPGA
jgi:Fe2+ or Zn2+ uptake regulation protein